MQTSNASQRAALKVIERRRCRTDFLSWCRATLPLVSLGTEPAAHQKLLIEKLQRVALGDCRRLALYLPPGSAKSTYSSVLFPPWYLAQAPKQNILACSHSIDKAEEFGRKCRNLIEEQFPVLGYRLQDYSRATGRWETTNGGTYLATGVGAGIAGYRADLVVIDDPIGKKEDADSEQTRAKQWEWYITDVKPRLKPHGAIVLIQTRWHEDDLGGRIIEHEGGDWEVIRLPLLAEQNDPLGRQPGEALWPEWYTPKMVADAQLYPETFSALYQQRPTLEEGDFFKADHMQTYQPEELPENLSVYVGSDHAVSTKESADRTCLLPAGVDDKGILWVLPDVWWKRAPSNEVAEAMLALCQRRKPIVWWAGKEHITQAMGPFLRLLQRERNIYIPLEEVTSVKNKRSRATSIRDRMALGKVRFPGFAPWWSAAKEEMLHFTGNDDKHDDFIDAFSELGRGLDRLVSPHRPRSDSPLPKVRSWEWLHQQIKQQRLFKVREY